LKPGGRAAIVLPDNCLFADQAGDVFKILTEDCDLHTVLRLPHGTFVPYSQGVRANVAFFTKGCRTEHLWIYDGRTNVVGITKKGRPLSGNHFAEFDRCYGADPNGRAKRRVADSPQGRWRSFDIAELRERDFKLDDFRWIKQDALENPDDTPDPEELADTLEITLRSIAQQLAKLSSASSNGQAGESLPTSSAGVDGLLSTLRAATDEWIEPSFEWRDRYDLPVGRAFVALGNLGDWGGGLTPSKANHAYWQHGTTPWVSPKDMKTTVLRGSRDHITERAVNDAGLRRLPAGTLLFVVRGMILAHTFPIAMTAVEVTINQDLRYLIPRNGIASEYLLFVLLHEAKHILFAVKESTHGTRRLESDILKAWPIPLLPTREQRQTAARIRQLSALVESVEESFKNATNALADLPQAMLTKALRDSLGLE
jgi:hypothetical protein